MVVSRQGPDQWTLQVDGRPWTVVTTLSLQPGDVLRLRKDPQLPGRWIVQESLPHAAGPESRNLSPLAAAFVTRGLPLVQEKLDAWQRWLDRHDGPLDKEGWAASLEARGQGPLDSLSENLQPWLTWQSALERGESPPAPGDEEIWDLWNSRKAAAGDPWLVQVVHWEHEGHHDSGLLQAHFHPQRQLIDLWNLTAAPNGTPLRVEAKCRPGGLALALQFFRDEDLQRWTAQAVDWNSALSSPEFLVTLSVEQPGSPAAPWKGGINVVI